MTLHEKQLPPHKENIEGSMQETVQTSVNNTNLLAGPGGTSMSLMYLLSKSNELIAPWWSRRRDLELRRFARLSDHISGAIYSLTSRVTTIEFEVQARDQSIKSHVDLAKAYTQILQEASQFGMGWMCFLGRVFQDLFGTDNGAFIEVIGPGDPAGPLEGMPISVAHLDSTRCRRTGNPIYPVIYEDVNGRLFKLHYTRVMYLCQMGSPDIQMHGVGFCAVSRCINAAQNLLDMAVYKQEKLGSRPQRQMFLTGGGLDPDDILNAVRMAERSMNNEGLSRYAKTIVAGNRNIPEPKLQVIDMAGLPDGFDFRTDTVVGMALISMAFGMDAKELFPSILPGATRADAIVQHMKQRMKGPGQALAMLERQFDLKFLPPFLHLSFDHQDDSEDRAVADIMNVRAQARQRDLMGGITDVRTERERMRDNFEITAAQFEALELTDGRTEDGVDVAYLFNSPDRFFQQHLGVCTADNADSCLEDLYGIVLSSRDPQQIKKARQAIAAINKKFVQPMEDAQNAAALAQDNRGRPRSRQNMPANQGQVNASQGNGPRLNDSYQQEKVGKKQPKDATQVTNETDITSGEAQ